MRINKDKKVRMSKWHVIPLSREQKVYAAIDAYVGEMFLKKACSFSQIFVLGFFKIVSASKAARKTGKR